MELVNSTSALSGLWHRMLVIFDRVNVKETLNE